MGASLRAWARQPGALVLLLALAQVLFWGVLSAHWHAAPQDDSLEQVLLSQEFALAYGKHPPLPTWLLYAANQLFGASIGATFVLSALCSAATVLLLYAWARPLVGESRAALAALLASCVEFMNAGTTYFNHNTVQLPFALLAIVLFHRALTRGRLADWAWFGVGAALAMLAKFSAVVLFAAFAVYLVWSRRVFDARTLRGLGVAAAGSGVLLAPHLIAAFGGLVAPDEYAADALYPAQFDRIERLKSVWTFGTSHLAKVAPALLIFFWLRRRAPAAPASTPQPAGETLALAPFLAIVGFGPLLLTLAIAALSGAYLLVGWGTTFHVVLTLWLVAARPFAIDAPVALVQRAAIACIALQVLLWALVTANGGTLPNLRRLSPVRTAPAPPELADAVRRAWGEQSTAPLHYVLSEQRIGAPLAARFGGTPRVVNARRSDLEAVLPAAARAACGYVVVAGHAPSRGRASPAPDALGALFDQAAPPLVFEARSGTAGARQFFIGVRPPTPGEGCTTKR
jgi:4-amino-4-deoxy-L-arabinose transferase-like glycosyltransferase